MTISLDLRTQILRLYQVERWPAGTIARQLHVHRDTVKRVHAATIVVAVRAKGVPRPREEPAQGAPSPEDGEAALGRPMRLGWAKLLKRVFNLDLEHCSDL
jgi:hypothetical protein